MYVFIVCVLIDTWWNVNINGITNYTVPECVLIDTWWNVNKQDVTIFVMDEIGF